MSGVVRPLLNEDPDVLVWVLTPASLAFDVCEKHRLRAGDALQLAAALKGTRNPSARPFVTLDHDLASAARAEGFPVLP
jgi:predicted nucleic acid-binding protein